MNKPVRAALLVAGVTALTIVPVHGATADPTKAQTFTLVCDNGHTYTVVVNSSGAWSPAHDVNSTSTLIPLSFGETTGTVTDLNGNVVDSFSDPAMAKRSAATYDLATTTACTFSSDDTFVSPDLGPLNVHVEGSVVGFVTPV
jgi:hypothetical protein